uniref:Uncharacterized protein n=1 Tax=Solanum tuberosum TaxID=4113 RepID=M1D4X6_SOLTU
MSILTSTHSPFYFLIFYSKIYAVIFFLLHSSEICSSRVAASISKLTISFKIPPYFVLRVLKMWTYICSPDVGILIVKSFELHVEFLVNWLSGKS